MTILTYYIKCVYKAILMVYRHIIFVKGVFKPILLVYRYIIFVKGVFKAILMTILTSIILYLSKVDAAAVGSYLDTALNGLWRSISWRRSTWNGGKWIFIFVTLIFVIKHNN